MTENKPVKKVVEPEVGTPEWVANRFPLVEGEPSTISIIDRTVVEHRAVTKEEFDELRAAIENRLGLKAGGSKDA